MPSHAANRGSKASAPPRPVIFRFSLATAPRSRRALDRFSAAPTAPCCSGVN